MGLKTDLFLARILNTELKYQYLKNTPRFQKNDLPSIKSARKYLVNNVRSSLLVNTFIYGVISVIFGVASIESSTVASSESFVLFLLLLILAIMTDTQFYRGIWDMKLLAPITQLPIKLEKRVVPYSLFFYNEFYLPFVTVPAGAILSYGMRSPLPILVFIMFTVLFVYIARIISLVLGVTFVKTNTNRKSKRLYLGQIFQVLIFVIFILAIEIATNPSFQAYVKVPSFLFFFIPVTHQFISTLSPYPFLFFAGIFAIVYPTYTLLQRRSLTEKMETFANISGARKEDIAIKTKKPVGSLVDKDFKVMFRRRGAIMIMVLPMTFIIPIIPPLLSAHGNSSQVSYYVSYISLVLLIDFILLTGLEGKAAWHLSALPMTRRQFFYSKLLSVFSIGIIYYAVLVIIIAFANRSLVPYILLYFPLFCLILMAVLFAGGTYLVRAIPNEVYSLSQQGIGGRWILMKAFIIGTPITLTNVFLFSYSKYFLNFHISYYFKGYSLTIILDALISYLFLRLLIKRGDHF